MNSFDVFVIKGFTVYNSKQSKQHFIRSFDEPKVLGLTVLYNSYIGLKQKAVKGIIYRLE